MDTPKSAAFAAKITGHRGRRAFVFKLGALALGSTVAFAAAAEPVTKQRMPQPVSQPRFSPPAPVANHGPVPGPAYQAPARAAPVRAAPTPAARVAPAPAYRFGTDDRARLQRHYRSTLPAVRADRRPYFSPGRTIPGAYRPYITPVPARLGRHLPPPPRGYRIGYYQGYSVVYDPVTFTILSVLDLLIH